MKTLFLLLTLFFATGIVYATTPAPADTGIGTSIQADTPAVSIKDMPTMPSKDAPFTDWVFWVTGVAIVVMQVIVKLVPTAQSTNIFKVIYNILCWIFKVLDNILGLIVPDKKKGGGTH